MAYQPMVAGKNTEIFFIKLSKNILFIIFQPPILKYCYNIFQMLKQNANFYSREINLCLYPPMISA